MERKLLKIGDKAYPYIHDEVLIGKWEEVNDIPANTIKSDLSAEKLDGLILYGYEMKWGQTNENGERYEQTAFDGFINDYFVGRGLNMPVSIEHSYNWADKCGRVLYIERNSTGFYFVVYIPRDYPRYTELLWAIKNGILQGFSKEGYATDWEWKYKADGSFDYELIKEMKLIAMSIVTTPANGIGFERVKETKNGLVFVTEEVEEKKKSGKSLDEMFNKNNF